MDENPGSDTKALNQDLSVSPVPQASQDEILGPLKSPDISNHTPKLDPIPGTHQNITSGINQIDQAIGKAEVFEPLETGGDQGQEPVKILSADRPVNGSPSIDSVSPSGSAVEDGSRPRFNKAEAHKIRPPRVSDHTRKDRIPPGARKGKYPYPSGKRLKPMEMTIIRAMDKMGYSKAEIARQQKISTNTVNAVLARMAEYPSDLVDAVRQTMSSAYWINARRPLGFIDDEKLAKSSAVQLATVSAIMVDKALLLDGKPTSRTEHVSASDPELEKQIEALETQLNTFKGVKTVYNAQDNTSSHGEGMSNA